MEVPAGGRSLRGGKQGFGKKTEQWLGRQRWVFRSWGKEPEPTLMTSLFKGHIPHLLLAKYTEQGHPALSNILNYNHTNSRS